jgi:hypothetical protein
MKFAATKNIALGLLVVTGLYFGLTWLFLGSSHPCEVYYHIVVKPTVENLLEKYPHLRGEDNKDAIPRSMYERIHALPPAKCLWRTIIFQTNCTP